jgi:uncharacterized lipoprotein YddW (UPF0748 family)
MMLLRLALCGLLLLSGGLPAASYLPTGVAPPAVSREFRGVWVASIGNIDWPSRAGLSTAEQKAEFLALLDRAEELRLNAVILQVRPSSDALYASKLEPWSEYLTGRMGQAPEPYYDPLEFTVAETHRRGMELHAWFNPFRARHSSARSPVSGNHITKTKPQLVRTYGKYLWLDPGEPAVQDHAVNVITDVVRRYDIDGVHIDDYFYPYKEKDAAGKPVEFPDNTNWGRYLGGGGKLERDDWRRENVNRFVQRLAAAIKVEKSWVKFGVSPFGIWRPGNPAQIRGMDAYADIYADSRKWLVNGWVDYFSPQLYWSTSAREQSYPVLLKWWAEQNVRGRHLWPGLAIRTPSPRSPKEITSQIKLTRNQAGSTGNLLWSMKSLLQNKDGIGDLLRREAYTQPALIPASPWLDAQAPSRTRVVADDTVGGGNLKVWWSVAPGESVARWVVQSKVNGKWRVEIFAGQYNSCLMKGAPEYVAVSAVDRAGNLGPATVLERKR